MEEEEEGDWVMVKKQKIVILVPPPSPAEDDHKSRSPEATKEKPNSAENISSPLEHNLKAKERETLVPLVKPIRAVKQRIRAANLERRLERVGGLRRYLLSLRLSRFVQMIEEEKLDKFQLAGLTMGKLKEMGAYAVGPRRKLLCAIDRLCWDPPMERER